MSKNTLSPLYICLAAGGTGGHIMPALSIAHALRKDGHKILMLTDKRGKKLIPEEMPTKILASASPFTGSIFMRVLALAKLCAGLLNCLFSFAIRRPALLIGFGGYPAAAPMCAGWCMGLPVLMHEQNAIIGRTNLMLARFAKALLTSWPDNQRLPAQTAILHTGLPVRSAFGKISTYSAPKRTKEFHLAVFGGSLGAALFGDIVSTALAQFPAEMRARLRVTQQVKAEQKAEIDAFYKKHAIQAETAVFFNNVDQIMEKCDLVISRSGASSVAEIANAGRAAIFIPFARALDNHQYANAQQLCQHGGGICIEEAVLDAPLLAEKIALLMRDDKQRLAMATAAAKQAQKAATQNIIQQIYHLAKDQKKEAA